MDNFVVDLHLSQEEKGEVRKNHEDIFAKDTN